jgi:hypothetical protein
VINAGLRRSLIQMPRLQFSLRVAILLMLAAAFVVVNVLPRPGREITVMGAVRSNWTERGFPLAFDEWFQDDFGLHRYFNGTSFALDVLFAVVVLAAAWLVLARPWRRRLPASE